MNTNKFELLGVCTVIAIWFTMQSCNRSLVYSPALNLPSKPLKQNETDIHTAVEFFPETRPSSKSRLTSAGISTSLGYGFSDRFNMYGRLWITAKSEMIRSGMSINGHIIRRIDENQNLTIMPRIGVVMYNNSIQGYGFSASSIYTSRFTKNTSIYGGAGLLWGIHYLGEDINSNGESKIPMGFGLLMHAGFVWDLTSSIRVNIEINPIYQINTFDQSQQLVISPTLGLGYTFHN